MVPIQIQLKTSWTELNTEYKIVTIIEVKALGINHIDELEDKLVDLLQEDLGFEQHKEYVINTGLFPGSLTEINNVVLRIRNNESFTLFKLKYYG